MSFGVSEWNRFVKERQWLLESVRPALVDKSFVVFAIFAAFTVLSILTADVLAGLAKHKGMISDSAAYVLRISNDGSIGEMAGHIALQVAALLMLYVAIRLVSPLHACLAGILQFLVLDDVLEFHERAGSWMGDLVFPHTTFAQSHVWGELCIGLLFSTIIIVLLVAAYQRSTVWQNLLCAIVVAPLFLLGMFGVGVDFVHAILPQDDKFLMGIAALVEDGGELFSMALVMLGALAGYLRFDASPVGREDSLHWDFQLASLRDDKLR